MNDLPLLRGGDYAVNEYITIRQPTLGEICDYGEERYWALVTALCAIPSDMKSALYDSGIDFEELSEFQLFYILTRGFDTEATSILFGDKLDLSEMELFCSDDGSRLFLSRAAFGNPVGDLTIDSHVHVLMTDCIRQMHQFTKDVETAGNEYTKQILIDEDREKIRFRKNSPFQSALYPLILATVNCGDFKYDFDTVWNLRLPAFMASVRQIQRSKNVSSLMQGIYSGCIDSTKLNKDDLNWI